MSKSNTNSNGYTITYVAVMTVIVAVCLALAATGLKEKQDYNVEIATKTDILKAVNMDKAGNIEEVFNDQIKQVVIDAEGNVKEGMDALTIDVKKESKKPVAERSLPLFIFTNKEGAKNYIIPLRGFGLWDEIWGYVALGSDMNAIVGVAFDHKAETPGLGAEIKDNPTFGEQFIGKTIFNESNDYTSVAVIKGELSDPEHQVHSISGATMTSTGVSNMLYKDITNYLAYFKKLRSNS